MQSDSWRAIRKASCNGPTRRESKRCGLDAESGIEVPAGEFDYLFSVANLRVLPAALIARARKLALNFHDAPLPRYAGLNATSWALMAQEKDHGVTWHEMTPAVDAGRIVRQATFAIGPAETAFSLNTKCYEAGLAIFESIVQDIARGDLSLTEQTGHRSYFGRDRRPDAMATLDFSRPATELAALRACARLRALPQPAGSSQDLSGRLGGAGSRCERRIHPFIRCARNTDRSRWTGDARCHERWRHPAGRVRGRRGPAPARPHGWNGSSTP